VDGRGARLLAARIESGVKPGDRVELVSLPADSAIRLGERGVVTDVDEDKVYVAWDSGLTLSFDPAEARLRLSPSAF